ncbi:MAG: phycobiliprotein lyase [Spirulinaceae cyanobacterium RM2_2_10]|nr:phycobiliprotein lyase [Spirulinaceae cyanobacterium SM2_1_0]NJO19263.1 phycobiliprotein lyase [Spirulinaceae cyanobacterium RM2_2_10]
MDLTTFREFFDCCVGRWTTERTYHYLTTQAVERSHTEFQITRLDADRKRQVLTDNQYDIPPQLENLQGFALGFHTVSETGEEVSQQLNLLFVPKLDGDGVLEGDYLRDRAYEESRPIISHFRFTNISRELLMTTEYTRVTSVDSITLINPTLRIRRIYNFQRPEPGQPLEQMRLVGFGVEQKDTA